MFDQLLVCFAGHFGDSELDGSPAWKVGYDFFHTMHKASPEIRQVWLDEFVSGSASRQWNLEGPDIVAVRKREIDWFREQWPKSARGPWRNHFWRFLNQYLQVLCANAGHEYRADKLYNADYYRGRKLHFALLYLRHYLRPKAWNSSDWLDTMHA